MPAISAPHRRARPLPAPVLWLLALLTAASCWAHDPMSSWAVVRLPSGLVELEVELSREAAMALLGTPMGSAPPPPDPTVLLEPLQYKAETGEVYQVHGAGRPLALADITVELRDEDGVGFRLLYVRPTSAPLRFEAAFLAHLKPEHRSTLTVLGDDDAVLQSTVLGQASPLFEYSPPVAATSPTVEAPLSTSGSVSATEASPPGPFRAFLKLGVEHILLGYDHLLFLGGLLLGCRRLKTMAGIITCFTLAHSLTLGLAALDVATLPGRLVEPLIAASIVFVGVENLFHRDREPRSRWALTLLFGLVHGFGFASVLREIGFGSAGDVVVPLFAFNLGVELGQLAVASIAIAALWPLRERPVFLRYAQPALSGVVAAAGAIWLTQRLLQA